MSTNASEKLTLPEPPQPEPLLESVLILSPQTFPPDQNPAIVYLSLLRPTGRRSQKQALESIAALLSNNTCHALNFPWHKLRYQHTAALRAHLTARNPATANKILSALRRVLLEAKRLGLLSAEEYSAASEVHNIKAETAPRGRALSKGELTALMEVCAQDQSIAGIRDAAMIALMYGAGLRRSEVVALDLEHLELVSGALNIKSAKGGKDRTTYLSGGALLVVSDWVMVRGTEPGPLLCPINKGGKIKFSRLNSQGIFDVLVKRGRQAGLKAFSPHDLRRTFVSDLLDAGADIVTVQKLAGHASVTTTARYDRRGEDTKRRTASLLQLPYIKRNGAKD